MKRTPGLYVTPQKGGIIKRNLVTNKGETVLDETTIGAELIWYAELDYNTYVDPLIKIEDLAEKTEDDGDPENYGTVYLNQTVSNSACRKRHCFDHKGKERPY